MTSTQNSMNHPCPTFNDGLAKLSLNLRHGWVIASHMNTLMRLLIHVSVLINSKIDQPVKLGALLSIRGIFIGCGHAPSHESVALLSWLRPWKRNWTTARFHRISSAILNYIIWSTKMFFKPIKCYCTHRTLSKSRLCSHGCDCWWSGTVRFGSPTCS